jgi:hypothetical protein
LLGGKKGKGKEKRERSRREDGERVAAKEHRERKNISRAPALAKPVALCGSDMIMIL